MSDIKLFDYKIKDKIKLIFMHYLNLFLYL